MEWFIGWDAEAMRFMDYGLWIMDSGLFWVSRSAVVNNHNSSSR